MNYLHKIWQIEPSLCKSVSEEEGLLNCGVNRLGESHDSLHVSMGMAFHSSYLSKPFYCYAYSFGNLLVLALYQKYKEQGESFIPRYLELLSTGRISEP